MAEGKRLSLVKPTLETPFHIDFNWWSQNDREWRVHLLGLLTSEEKERFANIINGDDLVDWVDPDTGRNSSSGWSPACLNYSYSSKRRLFS